MLFIGVLLMDAAEAQEASRLIHFRTLGFDLEEELYLAGREKEESIAIRRRELSPWYACKVDGLMQFYEKPASSGERTCVAAVPISADAREVLLVFFREEKGDKFKVVVFDDSLKTFPEGAVEIVNLTGMGLVAKMFNEEKGISAARSAVWMPPGSLPARTRVTLLSGGPGRKAPLHAQEIYCNQGRRTYVFLNPSLQPLVLKTSSAEGGYQVTIDPMKGRTLGLFSIGDLVPKPLPKAGGKNPNP